MRSEAFGRLAKYLKDTGKARTFVKHRVFLAQELLTGLIGWLQYGGEGKWLLRRSARVVGGLVNANNRAQGKKGFTPLVGFIAQMVAEGTRDVREVVAGVMKGYSGEALERWLRGWFDWQEYGAMFLWNLSSHLMDRGDREVRCVKARRFWKAALEAVDVGQKIWKRGDWRGAWLNRKGRLLRRLWQTEQNQQRRLSLIKGCLESLLAAWGEGSEEGRNNALLYLAVLMWSEEWLWLVSRGESGWFEECAGRLGWNTKDDSALWVAERVAAEFPHIRRAFGDGMGKAHRRFLQALKNTITDDTLLSTPPASYAEFLQSLRRLRGLPILGPRIPKCLR